MEFLIWEMWYIFLVGTLNSISSSLGVAQIEKKMPELPKSELVINQFKHFLKMEWIDKINRFLTIDFVNSLALQSRS